MSESSSSNPSSSPDISVLFVCLGNICRSPLAEAVFRSLTNNLPSSSSPPHPRISTIDSAGTAGYHARSPPDPRTISTLNAHFITDYDHGARRVVPSDFEKFTYILAMDRENLRNLRGMRGNIDKKASETGGEAFAKQMGQVRLFGEFGGGIEEGTREDQASMEEVVDPYYGADDGFEIVFGQVERFSKAFLKDVVEKQAQ